ncbi:phage integrase SAM-like domain-containing protein [Lactiplantibacillus plantarum]|uniref:phage integrase SAM-like domain-containing protein n=4 Tax=Lactiplantibacillus plantarum TaxID=1590 RepID=UPI000B1AD3A5|nr:phage integrase SAM-like domain-containing protein [Lactiplantibacillus plantarum]
MSRGYRNRLKGRKYKAEVSVGSGSTRKRKTKTFNNMTEARIWIHQMEIMADRGTDFEKSRWLFIDYYWQWVQLYKKPVVSANTMHTYWTSYQHFSQGLGDVRLEDLTRNRIQKYLNGLDLSHESIRKDLMQLRSCLHDAVSDGVLTHNPAAGTLRIVADPSRTKGAE